jgi:hypothetical protein
MTQRFGCHSGFGTLVLCSSASVIALALTTTMSSAQVRKVGDPPESKNMRLVGQTTCRRAAPTSR